MLTKMLVFKFIWKVLKKLYLPRFYDPKNFGTPDVYKIVDGDDVENLNFNGDLRSKKTN